MISYRYKRNMWEYYPDHVNTVRLRKTNLLYVWKEPVLVLSTYSDMTSRYLSSELYQERLTELGIVPRHSKLYKNTQLGIYFRAAILPLLVNPKPYLCEVVNKHLKILRKRKIIGVQMRLGGTKANYNEREFLGPKCVSIFAKRVEDYIRMKNWNRNGVYVFVSTDSSYALREITKMLNTNDSKIVYSVDEWKIGHSALSKTLNYGEKQRDSFMNRAILDLLILKESDYLVYSHGSSYGQMAYELQQSYRYPVHSYKYISSRHLKCTVFRKRKHMGEASYVSRYAGKSATKTK